MQQDWSSDVGENDDMNAELFRKSIFELIDHWCDDLEVEKYIELTNTLFGIMQTLETRRQEKRDRMAKPDWDPLTTTVGVSPIFHIRLLATSTNPLIFQRLQKRLFNKNGSKRRQN